MKPSQVVVITGASAGVGRATARAFAARGASIGLLARGRAGLAAAEREVEAAGGRAVALPTDVADPDRVEAAAAAVEDRFGPIDVWVNNAMASVFSPVSAMTAADFKRVTDVTYLGVVHGTLAALRRMMPRNRGSNRLPAKVNRSRARAATPYPASRSRPQTPPPVSHRRR